MKGILVLDNNDKFFDDAIAYFKIDGNEYALLDRNEGVEGDEVEYKIFDTYKEANEWNGQMVERLDEGWVTFKYEEVCDG